MAFYILRADVTSELLVPLMDYSSKRALMLDLAAGKSLARKWEVPKFDGELDDGILKDFASTTCPGIVAVRKNAWSRIAEALVAGVELLPVNHPKGVDYHLLNVLTVIDGLDRSKSSVRFAASDGKTVVDVKRYCFDHAAIESANIFRTPETLFDYPIVSQAFRNAVDQLGLTGTEFKDLPTG